MPKRQDGHRRLLRSLLSHVAVSFVAFTAGTLHGSADAGNASRCLWLSPSILTVPESSGSRNFIRSLHKFSRREFLTTFDSGLPIETSSTEPVVLFQSGGTFVSAVDECDTVKVVYTSADRSSDSTCCYAIVENAINARHVHTFQKRTNTKGNRQWSLQHAFANSQQTTLQPKPINSRNANRLLLHYLTVLDDVLETLKPMAKSVAESGSLTNTIVVLVCNWGHAELLMNFCCASRKVGVDLKDLLVFAIDAKIAHLATSLGLTVYYHEQLFQHIPQHSAEYGSLDYAQIMMSKVYAVHLISTLGYDFVFQDVDMVPYRAEYLQVFMNTIETNDVVFQYDHSMEPIYLPYSANSGFFYAKSNMQTKYFFEALLKAGDMILRSKSHQAVIAALLSEHVSLFGLKVKILYKESDDFPVGFHFHRDRDYMKALIRGENRPYVFHQNWNNEKDMKRKFNEQLGDWYVSNKCSSETMVNEAQDCCVDEPIPVCYFRDKPSKIPCPDSPLIEDETSFW